MDDLFSDRRSGTARRRAVPKRNGLAVLMAGCSECGRIAPSPADMHAEGWEIESNALGLVRITCPVHGAGAPAGPPGLPDYIVGVRERVSVRPRLGNT
jgi:hypothetical protein